MAGNDDSAAELARMQAAAAAAAKWIREAEYAIRRATRLDDFTSIHAVSCMRIAHEELTGRPWDDDALDDVRRLAHDWALDGGE